MPTALETQSVHALASRKLSVTLQKVTANDEVSINLVAIKANYDPVTSVQDLNELLDNEDFTDIVLDAPTSFEIIDTGEDYDIDTVDEIEAMDNIYEPILYSAYSAMVMLKKIDWKYHDDSDFFDYINQICAFIEQDIDTFNYFCKRDYGCFVDVYARCGCEQDDYLYLENSDFSYLKQLVTDIISDYINVVEYYSVNIESEEEYEMIIDNHEDLRLDLRVIADC